MELVQTWTPFSALRIHVMGGGIIIIIIIIIITIWIYSCINNSHFITD